MGEQYAKTARGCSEGRRRRGKAERIDPAMHDRVFPQQQHAAAIGQRKKNALSPAGRLLHFDHPNILRRTMISPTETLPRIETPKPRCGTRPRTTAPARFLE